MRNFFKNKIYALCNYLEIFISVLLIVAIAVLGIKLAGEILTGATYSEEDAMNQILAGALTLAVGLEFVKMLSKHTPSTVIEVLMFATARQMVVEHYGAVDTLIGVATIAALFATRKFLFCSFDEIEKTMYRANQKVRLINHLAHINIPIEDGETLGDVLRNQLLAEDEPVAVGSCVYYHDFALKVAKMRDNEITRIEVIKSL